MNVAVGQTLGTYDVLQRVGQGGMAVVYRGYDTSLKREVAIKVLHPHLASKQEARERFAREAQAVAKLRHPNILEIYAFSAIDEDTSYIVTEFIHGPTLASFSEGYTLKHPEVGAMICAILCDGLASAHAGGILHRDIKPENIMIRDDGVLKITDFGIAQMLDHERVTATGQLLGSPAYMSPENLEGKRLDERSDVFALGVVLYELMVGRLPFSGKNPHQTIKKIAEGTYPDPISCNPSIQRALSHVVKKALARDREQRYATVSELAQALREVLAICELNDLESELPRFFATPAPYEMALSSRLTSSLTTYAKEEKSPQKAVDALSRVLTIKPDHEESLRLINEIGNSNRSGKTALVVAGAIAGIVGIGLWGFRDAPTAGDAVAATSDAAMADAFVADAANAAFFDAPPVDAAPADANAASSVSSKMASSRASSVRSSTSSSSSAELATYSVRFAVNARDAEMRLDREPWIKLSGNNLVRDVPAGSHRLQVKHPCCMRYSSNINIAKSERITVRLNFKPASLIVQCEDPATKIFVRGRNMKAGRRIPIPITSALGQEKVVVSFANAAVGNSKQDVIVRPAESKTIQCPTSSP